MSEGLSEGVCCKRSVPWWKARRCGRQRWLRCRRMHCILWSQGYENHRDVFG